MGIKETNRQILLSGNLTVFSQQYSSIPSIHNPME